MNAAQHQCLLDTLDELEHAIETSDRSSAKIALSFARRLCAPPRRTIHGDKDAICENALHLASEFTSQTKEDILSKKRSNRVAEARQLAYYLARNAATPPGQLTYLELASYFQKDHGTILHGCRTIQNHLYTKPESSLARELPNLLARIRQPENLKPENLHPQLPSAALRASAPSV